MEMAKKRTIGLLGYGKMGKAVERIAVDRGHSIGFVWDRGDSIEFSAEKLQSVDVIIDFTHADIAERLILRCIDFGKPVVSGTTGWHDRLNELKLSLSNRGVAGFFHATNFSIGVHVFNKVAGYLSQVMDAQNGYDVLIEETHHIHKKDAPSGTAITLANRVISELSHKESWGLATDDIPSNVLRVHSKRIGGEFGRHELIFHSELDCISLTHKAYSRDAFASGAVRAAEWLIGRKGVFGMDDLIG
jgi:4-hydroxy-tetrahydrodipicolinate reductase